MIDPLAQVVSMLQPTAAHSKIASGAGYWRVERLDDGRPFYCATLEGCCRLAVGGHPPLVLEAGDFVLIPSAHDFAMSSLQEPPEGTGASASVAYPDGEFRHGSPDGPPDVRMIVGYGVFRSPDAALLASLLPRVVHIRRDQRLAAFVQLLREESRAQRPAREVILERLVEIILIEALRSAEGPALSPGLLRGLADERLSIAIRHMHESPAQPWTVTRLAQAAALSRSTFFERFHQTVGVAPMEYLLDWRMALAKDLLRRRQASIAEVAARVGYSGPSTFSVAFARQVGVPPARYARELSEAQRAKSHQAHAAPQVIGQR